MEIVDERLQQAEGQLAYWREQVSVAGRQAAMWEGAVEALRGLAEALHAATGNETGYGEDDVARLKHEEQSES